MREIIFTTSRRDKQLIMEPIEDGLKLTIKNLVIGQFINIEIESEDDIV